ncbi:hypothetical protein HOLleu_30564 [Holothuria leucospilota]|uniref:Uncharacterized protein n=1 Tax=Holothuria leucospilota TaxID=206669 RepID=A0A9Q1BKS1_HOLLE|nr:hypothetical protein HOLleu_30564 [Holothuria leucospilota]
MAVSKQCIRRVNQRPKPAHPRRTPQPASSQLSMQTSTTTSKIDIPIISPLSIIKVQNESNSKLPFPEHTTPSVNEKERNDSVSSTIVAFLFFGSLLLVVVVVCLVKGNVISTAVLKDKIYLLCCCSKSKKSAEEDIELADPKNNSPSRLIKQDTPAKSFEMQTSQPLLTGGDIQSHEDVFISPEKIEDDAFLPETENKRKAADDPEIQNRGSHDQDEDTGILVKGLMSINRLDLAQKLEKLDKPEKSDQPRRLRRSSSRQD